jgi:hypothetical protein
VEFSKRGGVPPFFVCKFQEHLIPDGKMLWIEKGVPKEIYDNAYQQQMMGPLERYGKVRIKGMFEYGDKYEHLGAYNSQIIPFEVELFG